MAKTMNRDDEIARFGRLTITYLTVDGRPVVMPRVQAIVYILETDFERLRVDVRNHAKGREELSRVRRPNQRPEQYARAATNRQIAEIPKREPLQLPVYDVQRATPASTARKLRDMRLEPWKIEKVTLDNVVEAIIAS